MPRVRRKSLKVRGPLPDDPLLRLLCDGPERPEPLDLDALRRSWEEYGESVLDLYLFAPLEEVMEASFLLSLSPRGPGRRPYCWWMFSAPEPARRRIAPGPLADPHWGVAFGVPRGFLDCVYINVRNPPCFETELEYLERHNEIGDEERQLLPGG